MKKFVASLFFCLSLVAVANAQETEEATEPLDIESLLTRSPPYGNDQLNTFSNVYYEALQKEDITFLNLTLTNQSSMYITLVNTEGKVSLEMSERDADHEKMAQFFNRWFKLAGSPQDDMVVENVLYQHPVVVVKGSTTYSNLGKVFFTQTFFFNRDFVFHTSLVVSSLPAAGPPDSVSRFFDTFFARLDTSSNSLIELFAPEAFLISSNRFSLDDGLFARRDHGPAQIESWLKCNYKPEGAPETVTESTILSWQIPHVVVKATLKDSNNATFAELLGTFEMEATDSGNFKIAKGIVAFEWPKFDSRELNNMFSAKDFSDEEGQSDEGFDDESVTESEESQQTVEPEEAEKRAEKELSEQVHQIEVMKVGEIQKEDSTQVEEEREATTEKEATKEAVEENARAPESLN